MSALLTLELVKVQLGIDPAHGDDDSYDEAITAALPLVTSWFEEYCCRGLAAVDIAAEEIFENTNRRIYTWAFPIIELVSVTVDGQVYAGSEFVVNKSAGYFFGGQTRPYVEAGTVLSIEYRGGYEPEDVPPDLAFAFANACGVRAGVPSASSSSGGGSAIRSIGLGSGALQVAFDTGTQVGGISGSYNVGDVPTEVQQYASVLDRYVRQRA